MFCACSKAEPPPPSQEQPQPASPSEIQPSNEGKSPLAVIEVSERAIPSVVNVATIFKPHEDLSPFLQMEGRQAGIGSGVIVREDGIVLTNNHVVKNAETIKVTLFDRLELDAEIIGADPEADIAVLRLKDPPKDLKALPLGDSSQVRLGELVVAVGNPFGVGETVTLGIISAKDRTNLGIVDFEDFIQTDAAINPGNSGGPLIDLDAHVVGINTAIFSESGGSQGIGFAVPSNIAKFSMDSILSEGRVSRAFLGVRTQDLTAPLAKALGIKALSGALVADIVPGSPAEKAGVRAQDLLLEIDDRPVKTASEFRNIVGSYRPHQKAKLKIQREGKILETQVELSLREPQI